SEVSLTTLIYVVFGPLKPLPLVALLIGGFVPPSHPSISVPPSKAALIVHDIDAILQTRSLSLKVARKLLGRLNWYAQLAPYLRSYTSGINSAISYMESSGRRSVTVGRSICADLNLWKVRIESLQCVVLPLPFDDPVVSGSDASTRGLGGWVSVPSEGRHPSVFFFQCGIQDIPSGILEFLVEDPAAGARPSDMACLEMLAMCLDFCLALSKAGSSHLLVLL
ncbi:hypothetical protein FOL46_004452, partial [Perkinsus olseni]